MKKLNRKVSLKRLLIFGVAIGVLFIKAECMFTPTLQQPLSANAGETIAIKLTGRFNKGTPDPSDHRLVVGFLAPKNWNAGSNTTMTYTSDVGNGVLTQVPANVRPNNDAQFPFYPQALKDTYKSRDPNLIDDNEWVVFWSDVRTYNQGQNVNFTVTINTKVGTETLLAKLGYYLGGTNDGSWNASDNAKVIFSDCFQVMNGVGDGLDYCNKPLAAISPLRGVDNDLLTLSYDNDLFTTELNNESEIYLCFKGYTDSGQELDYCVKNESTKMLAKEQKRFVKTFWPRKLFNLAAGQKLARIEYFLTDHAGTKKAGFGGSTSIPFIYRFNCD